LIKGIIFDLGSTLLHFDGDDEVINRQGAEAMADWFFKKKRIKLDGPALVEAFLSQRTANWKKAWQTQTEILAQESLRQALQQIDAPPHAEPLAEAAIKIYFAAEEACWHPYPDTIETLKQLKAQGYRLGLYSNATDDALIQRLINQSKTRPWLSPAFSSAGCGWRKPKPDGFALIAARWNLPAAEIVVVGDTLEADVVGAQNAGMHSILVTMDENPSNKDYRDIRPAAVAATLSQLPEIVARL
jgi:HAD superfamily hydrolase (TIGR01662 family)